MKTPRRLTFFNKVLEFQIKNKSDTEKLKILVQRLFGELEKQGHNIGEVSNSDCKHVSIYEFATHIDLFSAKRLDLTIKKEEHH